MRGRQAGMPARARSALGEQGNRKRRGYRMRIAARGTRHLAPSLSPFGNRVPGGFRYRPCRQPRTPPSAQLAARRAQADVAWLGLAWLGNNHANFTSAPPTSRASAFRRRPGSTCGADQHLTPLGPRLGRLRRTSGTPSGARDAASRTKPATDIRRPRPGLGRGGGPLDRANNLRQFRTSQGEGTVESAHSRASPAEPAQDSP